MTKDKQVLVIGAGIAGLVAAIEAASDGARVTVIDKLEPMLGKKIPHLHAPGGRANDTYRSGGGGLNHFVAAGATDETLSRYREQGWGRVNEDLIRLYFERVDRDCRWLRDDLGMPFDGKGDRVMGKGPAICRFLYGVCDRRGIKLLFETKALKLLTDGPRVTGARVRNRDGDLDLKAGAVVLAAGSFTGNHEMMLQYTGPEMAYLPIVAGSTHNTGDGLAMAAAAGAQLVNLSSCHMRTTDRFFGEGPSRFMVNLYHLGIYVNRDGRRFVDEGAADSDTLGNAIVLQPGGEATLIFDEKARRLYPDELETYPRQRDVVYRAGTLEDLANRIGVSAPALLSLVAEFNGHLRDGRTDGLPVAKTVCAVPIDTPPFYAFHPVLPAMNHPLGGLKTTVRGEVLDRENEPIPGLYAAGAIVNWAFGRPVEVAGVRTYRGSFHAGASGALAMALVFGRIAGHEAAAPAVRRG